VRARRIQAFVTVTPDQKGERMQLDNVHCEDDVRVHQDPVEPQAKPTDLAGQTLHLTKLSEGHVLVVTGTPAAPGEVHLPDLSLLGPRIKVDQVENVAEVTGIGSMRMDSQTDFQGKKLDRPTPLTVTWKQRMTFNGQQAVFHGFVQAEQDATSVLCNHMQVFLNRPVSLSQQSGAKVPNQEPAGVDKVICDNQGQELPQKVSIEQTERGPDGRTLLRYQRIESSAVALYKEEGRMEAAGPGTVRVLQPGPKDMAGPAAVPPKPGARPPDKKAEEEFKLTWVRYGESMRVFNPQRRAVFYKNVEVLHLPHDDPGLSLEFSKLVDRLPLGAVYLCCEVLEVFGSRDAAGKTHQEFTAKHRAFVQSQDFFGKANVIKYNEEKQLVIFEGSDGNLAEFTRIVVRGQEGRTIKSEKIAYNRLTGEVKTDKTWMITTDGN
jgi:hypothetical protein